MKAHGVVFTAPHRVEYKQVDCPQPGPGDVVVRVTHSWISNGTEGSYLRGERIDGDTPYREGDPWPFPIISGYQKIGVVEWLGGEVDDLEIGETVFAMFGRVEDLFDARAGHVSPTVTSRKQIWKLPAGIEPLAFSGLILTQVGYNAGSRGRIYIGESAVVIGDGLVGQWTAQTLAWRGAKVALIGKHKDRLDKFGSGPNRILINSTETDWKSAVQDIFPEGVQVAVDTVGSMEIMNAFFDLMKRDGHLVSAGFYGTQDRISLQPLRYKELSIELPSGALPHRLDKTIDLIAAGHLQTLPLITHHFPVQKAAEAWRLITEKSEPVMGVVLDW